MSEADMIRVLAAQMDDRELGVPHMNDPKPPTLTEARRWREMAANATEGPWWTEGGAVWVEGGLWDFRLLKVKTHIDPQATAAFIAASREAVPRLVEAYAKVVRLARPFAQCQLFEDAKTDHRLSCCSGCALRAAIPEDR